MLMYTAGGTSLTNKLASDGKPGSCGSSDLSRGVRCDFADQAEVFEVGEGAVDIICQEVISVLAMDISEGGSAGGADFDDGEDLVRDGISEGPGEDVGSGLEGILPDPEGGLEVGDLDGGGEVEDGELEGEPADLGFRAGGDGTQKTGRFGGEPGINFSPKKDRRGRAAKGRGQGF